MGAIAAPLFLAHQTAASDPLLLRLHIERSGDRAGLTWTGQALLESASRIQGPWIHIADAASPWTITPDQSAAFYRLRQPSFRLILQFTGVGQGTITSIPAGIACQTHCEATFPASTIVQLTANPAAGSEFAGWSGDGIGTSQHEVVMDRDRTVVAEFRPTAPLQSVLADPDFEAGPGAAWLQEPPDLIYEGQELGIVPYSGRYVARLGYDRDDRSRAAIGQRMTLPTRTPILFSFSYWIQSTESCDAPWWDTIGFYIEDEAVEENSRLCHSNGPTDGWQRVTYDLSPLAGQTVLIGFEISSIGGGLSSVVYLDAFEISH